ncbi:replication-relaxation family protein [Caldisalinibacter kiritimatiensis]|nr:replication-relaxation family protein [Caldisalinibacter kiritimatiensis]
MESFLPKKKNQKGTNEGYYLLDDAGAIFISGYYELPMKDVKWNKRDNLIKPEKLQHTFKICDVRSSLEKDARKKGHKIINCVSDRHLYFPFKHEENSFVLRPDMYFNYITERKQYTYFVEIDLGTMAMTENSFKTNSFDNKVYYYENFKLSEAYKEYLEAFPRILVITTTTNRAEKLAQAVKEKQKTKVEFLFTSFALWKEYPTGPIFLKTNGEYTSMFE